MLRTIAALSVLVFFCVTLTHAAVEREITSNELAQVYSNSTSFPATKPPIFYDFNFEDAPQAFLDEYGIFSGVTEMLGFFNTGRYIDTELEKDLVYSFEDISLWTEIKDKKNKNIFYAAEILSPPNRDGIDGIVDGVETRKVKLTIRALNALKIRVYGEITSTMDSDGTLRTMFTNNKPIKIPLVGTFLDTEGLKLYLKFVPYKNGYLLYSYCMISFIKVESDVNFNMVKDNTEYFFNFIKKRLNAYFW